MFTFLLRNKTLYWLDLSKCQAILTCQLGTVCMTKPSKLLAQPDVKGK